MLMVRASPGLIVASGNKIFFVNVQSEADSAAGSRGLDRQISDKS